MISGAAIILSVIIVVLVALYVLRNEEQEELSGPALEMVPGSRIQLRDGYTHYDLEGPAEGRTVVLVHGFSTWSFTWATTVQALAAAGFRVLRYDLFGRGYSDRPHAEYDKDLFDHQLSELLSVLNIRGRVDLVGSSMGGLITTTFAARRPEQVRTLSLIDPAFFFRSRVPFPLNVPFVGGYAGRVFAVPFLTKVQTRDFKYPERFPDYDRTYRTQMRYKGYSRAVLSTIRSLPAWDAPADFAQVGISDVPVLLIWGREDKTIPLSVSDRLKELKPEAELHIIDEAAHMPHYERPEIVDPILIGFLLKT